MRESIDTATSGLRSIVPKLADPLSLRLGAITMIVIVLSATSGLSGLALALGIGGLWIALPTIYTFAIAQLLYAVFVSPGGSVGILGALSFTLLLATEFRQPWPRSLSLRSLGAFAAVTLVFTGLFYATTPWSGLVITGLVFGTLAYGLHRYERLQLGFLEEDTQTT